MFERAQKVLTDEGIAKDSFQLQFAGYRNYNSSSDLILQHSTWTSKASELKKYLKNIEVDGGWGNEAVEVGLWHAAQEHKKEQISQVIIIGDAPPNTESDIENKRKGIFSRIYWAASRYSKVQHWAQEIKVFVEDHIPVHTFYVDKQAKSSFELIAKMTSGNCEELDIYSQNGSERLTSLVTMQILKDVGERKGLGNKLVDSYNRAYR